MLSKNSAILLGNPKAQGATEAIILVDETMGNQQATQAEIGWLAGIIDGEGYLGLQSYVDKRLSRYSKLRIDPCLHITNTDKEIILKSQKIMRKLGLNPYIRASNAHGIFQKDIYRLQTKHMGQMGLVLIAVLPYLTGEKAIRGKYLLEFIALRKSTDMVWFPITSKRQNGPMKPYSSRELELLKLCQANQRRGASETIRRAQRLTSEIWGLMKTRQLEAMKI